MSRRRRSAALLPLLLAALCAALGWKVYDDWRTVSADAAAAAPETAAAPAGASAAPLAAADLALALPPPERFAVIVERPLFSPTRRPAPPPEEMAQAEPPPEEPLPEEEPPADAEPPPVVDFTLTGIVIAGSERYALVERHEDGRTVQVTEGGDVNGWFAVLIDPDRAVFRNGATEEELLLRTATPVPQDRIPPRPAPPPPEEPDQQQQQEQEAPDQHQ
jgi:general secretion pathway protein N